MRVRFGLILSLALSASACSVIQERPIDGYNIAAMRHLQEQKSWYFEGRLAFTDEKDSISASISWRHRLAGDEIELSGPLAQGKVAILVSNDKVIVDDGDTRKEFRGAVDEVMSEQLGMDMPVNSLRYWVLGTNDPNSDYLEQGNGFTQSGWVVRFTEMQRVNVELLPRKITAEKDKARIKLIVDQWELS